MMVQHFGGREITTIALVELTLKTKSRVAVTRWMITHTGDLFAGLHSPRRHFCPSCSLLLHWFGGAAAGSVVVVEEVEDAADLLHSDTSSDCSVLSDSHSPGRKIRWSRILELLYEAVCHLTVKLETRVALKVKCSHSEFAL